ncbi:hypothetical protein ACWDA3_04680 [Nonomuraea rubra]
MKAAVVTSYAEPPHYLDFPDPRPASEHHVVVDVLAAGLHPRVRMQAAGSHYTSSDNDLPLVPGIDGVGRGPDGTLWYFMSLGNTPGSMAQRTLIDTRRAVALPPGTDPVMVAATLNCAIAPWLALNRRITFTKGQNVLVLGVTGGTGRMSIPVARLFGAGQVIAVGRDPGRLSTITGATVTALLAARTDPKRPLTWVQLGEMAGPHAPLPAALLRSSRLQLLGSGQGSLSAAEMAADVPSVAAEIVRGTFAMDATAVPLRDAEQAWVRPTDSSTRMLVVLELVLPVPRLGRTLGPQRRRP